MLAEGFDFTPEVPDPTFAVQVEDRRLVLLLPAAQYDITRRANHCEPGDPPVNQPRLMRRHMRQLQSFELLQCSKIVH